ncbi:MAG: hypothetical protein J7L10_02800 [Methanomicrobia archaeon]|nr:hypothetical protein [Methanomicrobia archaeon]RLF96885.1 MAG: hypothetical protein DRN50_00485 [Thermococci archaeon]RLG00597.1 MAG: hypothetical protein DRN58_03295 [Thermococci archaeon]
MKNMKVKYRRGNLKDIVGSLLKDRFTGSLRLKRGEMLFSDGRLIFVVYDNKLGKKNLKSIDETFDYKVEELENGELQLRIKWYELVSEREEGKNREEIIKDLGIPNVDKRYMMKILEKEDLLYLLRESGDNASSEE